jgi:hypothetical protein
MPERHSPIPLVHEFAAGLMTLDQRQRLLIRRGFKRLRSEISIPAEESCDWKAQNRATKIRAK